MFPSGLLSEDVTAPPLPEELFFQSNPIRKQKMHGVKVLKLKDKVVAKIKILIVDKSKKVLALQQPAKKYCTRELVFECTTSKILQIVPNNTNIIDFK
ncbi:hypothetical protein AVEN_41753-1 [Araneus ventricosus]|uniref:Uncharacterized protein n=1 Tax=Araneus ventricosus TaxID=182803 RepID=A0A4Y2AEE4_ARAVE|nr:hypothetical protein AVEN_41753-1 [Araneus ventricosus]